MDVNIIADFWKSAMIVADGAERAVLRSMADF